MATIEQYRFSRGDQPFDFINVSTAVGRTKAENHPDDVKVVQALLIYLDPRMRGFPKDKRLEWPTGAFNDATAWAIKEYQKHVNRRLYKPHRVIEDERVSPARGKYAFGRGSYMWTITSLNFDANEMALLSGHSEGYIERICRLFPGIKAVLKIA